VLLRERDHEGIVKERLVLQVSKVGLDGDERGVELAPAQLRVPVQADRPFRPKPP
jgi:hypothetical protein